MIDVTDVDLVKFAQKVYELSKPQGMGFLHYTSDPLTTEEAEQLVESCKNDTMCVLSMDYIKGRSCKMHVRRSGDKLTISDSWYDHTDEQLKELLRAFNVEPTAEIAEHGCACNCADCQIKYKRN